jgi:hypothetical protein
VTAAVSDPPVRAEVPTKFVVVVFAVAIVVGVAVAYFGIHGQFGGSIP